ncbi:MAG: porin family protein [bacterium]
MTKRTVVLTVAITLCVSFSIRSQPKFEIGFAGGLNFTNLDVELSDFDSLFLELNPELNLKNPDSESWTVFSLCGVLHYNFNKKITLRFEPSYVRKGAQTATTDFLGKEVVTTIKLSYFELPVLFKYQFELSPLTPYLLLGPRLGYLLSAKSEIQTNGDDFQNDIKNTIKKWNWELGLGAGVILEVGKGSWFVEARYARGLNNIDDTRAAFIGYERSMKTKAVEILTGFTWPLVW